MSDFIRRSVTEDLEFTRRQIKAIGGQASVSSIGIGPAQIYGGGGGGGSSSMSRFFGTAQQQYRANRDTVYTSIRPGAIKAASQPWQVGYTGGSAPKDETPEKMEKAMRVAPDFILKSFKKDGLKTLDDHPVYSLLENPNDFFDGWATVYCTYFSIELTGRSFWLINGNPERESGLELFYLPSHWVQPNHTEERLFDTWKIQPSGGQGFDVPFENVVYMAMPNPANPMDTYASLQSQARAVNIEDSILNCQYEGLQNGIHPSVVLKAGRLPNMPPTQPGQLPILTPEQRKQLITAVTLATQGPLNHREPFIVDGLIEDVIPYSFSQSEMDYPGSSQLTQDRIMAGFGTNPYVTGRIDNANRATATVAENSANSLQINPIINLISRAASRRIAPLFDGKNSKMKIWLEEAKSTDPDLMLSRVSLAPEIIPKGVLRKYMMTGELNIPELDDDDELMADAMQEQQGGDTAGAFNELFGGDKEGNDNPFGDDDDDKDAGDRKQDDEAKDDEALVDEPVKDEDEGQNEEPDDEDETDDEEERKKR